MGLKVTVQVDTSVPGGGRLRIVNQAVTGPAGSNGVGVPAGGTTGQVLAKASNANYDTEWAAAGGGAPTGAQYVTLAVDGTLTDERVLTAGTGITVTDGGAGAAVTVATSAILPTIIDAKGDLIVGSAADTAARLAVGTTGYLLVADSTATNGVTYTYNQVSQRAPQLLTANSYGIPGFIATNFNSQTGAIGRNQLHMHPFVVVRPITITKIAMRNIGAITSNTTMRCGIYASASTGLPTGNTLITSDLSYPNGTAAGTTVVNTVSLVLNPGLYWQVIVYTGGSDVSWHAWRGTLSNAIGIPNTGGQNGIGNFNSFTYGALPSAASLPAPGARDFWSTFYDWTWL